MKSAYVPGVVFAALGLPFAAWGLWLAAQRLVVVLSWPEAPAVVTDSRVETKDSRHAARIRVRFESPDGVVETDADHDHHYGGHASIAEAVERYPRGADVSVRFDPEDPGRARLEAGLNLATFGMPLLLGAAAASFGGIGLLALRSGRLQKAAHQATSRQARQAAERRDVRTIALFVLAIGVSFVVAGVALFPGAIEQRSWPEVTARVERTDVYARSSTGPRPGKGGSTTHYVVRVFLAYEYGGRNYLSPMDAGSSRNRDESVRAAAAIPKGDLRTIKVHPRRPNRIAKLDAWPLVFPSVFLAAGALVTAIAVLLLRR